jgi:hypothetical protein
MNTKKLPKTVGVEVELLAPHGLTRYDLAIAIAKRIQGTVHRFFHADSEPSKIPNQPLFYHLTPAFEVRDAQGNWFVRCVDDITLRTGLNPKAPAQAGWYRIISDDARLIGLIQQHTPADSTLADSLSAVGALFATRPVKNEGNVYRLTTLANEPIALAAPMPGERERACEFITAPLPYDNYIETLALLLQEAKHLGFLLPKEGASHLHFDGDAFTSAPVLAGIMNRLHEQRLPLRQQLNTNPHCTRIGTWSEAIINTINADDFRSLSWHQARQRLATHKISKYCDFNIRNLVYPQQDKHTFEVRTLPSSLDIEQFKIWAKVLHEVIFCD